MELNYIVYITINLCNGKFYIGVHKTNPNVFDGYIGCGIYRQSNASKRYAFHSAVRKYGYNSFKRTTLRIFPDTEEGKKAAYKFESELVTTTVLKSKACYNECVGGQEGITPQYMKKVNQFTLNGVLINSFNSVGIAAQSLGMPNVGSVKQAIKNCLQGKAKTAFGFVWSRNDHISSPINEKFRPVAQYTLSGKFLRHFNSIAEAENELQITTIFQAITKQYQAAGYQWRYFTGNCSDILPLIDKKRVYKNTPIIAYDLKGNKVAEYHNVYECKQHNKTLNTHLINRVLTGTQQSHKGFIFKYKDEDIV